MNKEVVGLALLRIQLVQGQALPQGKVALDAKVMLTWVDSCIEIMSTFQSWNTRGAMIEAAIPAGHQLRISAYRKNDRSDEALSRTLLRA